MPVDQQRRLALVATLASALACDASSDQGAAGAGAQHPVAGLGNGAEAGAQTSAGGAANSAPPGFQETAGSGETAGASSAGVGAGGVAALAGMGAPAAEAGTAGGGGLAEGQAGSAEAGAEDNAGEPFLPYGPDAYRWSTDVFELGPGEERYLCFARSVDEDLVINGYASKGGPFLHHMIFARTRQPEPEGLSECDVAFRSNWDQLYITGTGENRLEFPEDAGHVLPQGQQLLAQMHLLNVTSAPIEGSVTVHMRRSTADNPRPVTAYIFGTAAVDLPPAQRSEVVGTCPVRREVKLIAGFPHMHTLGAAMRFEVGPSAAQLREVYARDPFDFDDQHIDPLPLAIPAGHTTRVTCTFDNFRDERVGYGESTFDEMCYFVGFAVDSSGGSCLEVLPPNIFGG